MQKKKSLRKCRLISKISSQFFQYRVRCIFVFEILKMGNLEIVRRICSERKEKGFCQNLLLRFEYPPYIPFSYLKNRNQIFSASCGECADIHSLFTFPFWYSSPSENGSSPQVGTVGTCRSPANTESIPPQVHKCPIEPRTRTRQEILIKGYKMPI